MSWTCRPDASQVSSSSWAIGGREGTGGRKEGEGKGEREGEREGARREKGCGEGGGRVGVGKGRGWWGVTRCRLMVVLLGHPWIIF